MPKGGKEYFKKSFKTENQPFKMILLPEKVPNKKIYDVSIDFDEASKQWRKNKIHMGEGFFKYKRYSERTFNQKIISK